MYKRILQYAVYTLTVLVLLASSFLFMLPVYAATVGLTVNGESAAYPPAAKGAYVGAPGTFANLNSDDGDTSYWQATLGGYATWTWSNPGLPAGSTINKVTVYVKARAIAATNFQIAYYDGVNIYLGNNETPGAAYVTYSKEWTTNPGTGVPWTEAQVNSAEFGVNTGANALYTYMYVLVDYTSATAPTVVTLPATDIGYTAPPVNCTVIMHGEVTNAGGLPILERGFAWGTTCNSTTPDSTQPPQSTSYTTNWTEFAPMGGDLGIGTYAHSANLTCCTTFCYRAYARNAIGWGWGAEVTFVTMCDPDIDTQAATYVAATTARVNGLVIYDGEQLCDVRFCYRGGFVGSANCTDDALGCTAATCNATWYTTCMPWVNDTYETGDTPYVDLSGLTAATTYYVCSQIRNDMSCRCGGQITFTTSSGIGVPYDIKAIAYPTQISIFWIKGTGSSETLIRGKVGSYPTSITDGTLVYLDTQTSVLWTDRTPGTTYYLRLWGKSGALYSTTNATLMITTLASTVGGDAVMPTPPTPTQMFQAPDYTRMAAIPFYGIVNWWADEFQMPYATLWFAVGVFMSIAAGVFVYAFGGQKIILGNIAVIVVMGMCSFMGIVPMWLIVPFVIIAFSALALGERI